MTYDLFLGLLFLAFASSITPGPNNVMLMASGANFGLRRTLPHMFGVGFGFMFMILMVGFGLAGIFQLYPTVQLVMTVVSALYLLWLAWKIATAVPKLDFESQRRAKPFTFWQAAAFQWVNPKAWTMAAKAITLYVSKDNLVMGVLIVTVVYGAVNIPCITLWTWSGQSIQRFLHTPQRLRMFNIIMALLLVSSIIPVLM